MIWLGLFAGFGNHDCGTLAPRHLCLETGWVTYSRPKTAEVALDDGLLSF